MADLVTLDEARAALNIDDDDTDQDDELELYIDAVTAHFEDRHAALDDIPADLKVAALEDIRGLFQPGQIGPPGVFGAFGADSTEVGTTYRPVRLWPRVDAWLEHANRGAVGPSSSFPDAVCWPDPVER